MSEGILGFMGGILAALIGAIIAAVIQRAQEHHRDKSATRQTVYMLLLELHQQYFWIASAEATGAEAPEGTREACRKTAWRIADKLRSFDQVEHLDEILTLLFSTSILTANDRANRLEALLESYGDLVNPKYAKSMKKISSDNVLGQAKRGTMKTNAPGSAFYTR